MLALVLVQAGVAGIMPIIHVYFFINHVIRKMYILPSQVILQRHKMWHPQRMPGSKQISKNKKK